MKSRAVRKRLLVALITLIAIYILWLGVLLVRFRPTRPAISPRPGPPFEEKGAYHIHTTFSDGNSTPEKIAAIAARRSLDFIILTDHGSPNRDCLASQGRHSGVLVLAGSELSVSRGHLVALDFALPSKPFSQPAELAVQEVAAAGGFSVVAHPFSKVSWTWGRETDFSGIEIIDNDSMMKKNYLRALPHLPTLFIKPEIVLLKTLERPEQTLGKWDSLSAHHPLYGYFSADAHMFYSALFSCFRLHVLLDRPLAPDFAEARSQIFGALREGRFYNAIDAARPADGFLYWAEAEGARLPMGSRIRWSGSSAVTLRILAAFPFPVEIRLLRNGQTVKSTGEPELSFVTGQAGVYRVEVYLKGWSPLAGNVPWIVSNPIFLREGEL
jgi:hypothetical protein